MECVAIIAIDPRSSSRNEALILSLAPAPTVTRLVSSSCYCRMKRPDFAFSIFVEKCPFSAAGREVMKSQIQSRHSEKVQIVPNLGSV
ncbi:hypothetical protein AKJ16_DCAP22139 [Drosera capensis]